MLVSDGGGWALREDESGALISVHPSREAAAAEGRRRAQESSDGVELVVYGQRGEVEEHWEYGAAG